MYNAVISQLVSCNWTNKNMSRKERRKRKNISNQVGSESEKNYPGFGLYVSFVLFVNPYTVRSACIRRGGGGTLCLFLELNVTQHEAEILCWHAYWDGRGVRVAEWITLRYANHSSLCDRHMFAPFRGFFNSTRFAANDTGSFLQPVRCCARFVSVYGHTGLVCASEAGGSTKLGLGIWDM